MHHHNSNCCFNKYGSESYLVCEKVGLDYYQKNFDDCYNYFKKNRRQKLYICDHVQVYILLKIISQINTKKKHYKYLQILLNNKYAYYLKGKLLKDFLIITGLYTRLVTPFIYRYINQEELLEQLDTSGTFLYINSELLILALLMSHEITNTMSKNIIRILATINGEIKYHISHDTVYFTLNMVRINKIKYFYSSKFKIHTRGDLHTLVKMFTQEHSKHRSLIIAHLKLFPKKYSLYELTDKYIELLEENEQLENEINHLKYKPEGPGYHHAKMDFEECTKKIK